MPSAKVLEQKKGIVADLNEKLTKAVSGVLVDYRGLTVEQDTNLRRQFREAGVDYKVIKNTLIRLALKGTGLEDVDSVLENPTSIALSYEDPVVPAKIITEFAKKNDNLEIKAGFVEGKVINADETIELGKIPSKDVLVARAVCGINSPIVSFVIVLNQIAEKKAAEGAE